MSGKRGKLFPNAKSSNVVYKNALFLLIKYCLKFVALTEKCLRSLCFLLRECKRKYLFLFSGAAVSTAAVSATAVSRAQPAGAAVTAATAGSATGAAGTAAHQASPFLYLNIVVIVNNNKNLRIITQQKLNFKIEDCLRK